MAPPKKPAPATSGHRSALDLYFTSRLECPLSSQTLCHETGHEHTAQSDSDSMHRNVDARWTSPGCEEFAKHWTRWGGGAHCPVYQWEVVDSLKHMVDRVEKHCGDDAWVRVLRLKGHGNGGSGFWVALDAIDAAHLGPGSPFLTQLERLSQYLVPGLSLVLLEHCKAGRAEALLKKISRVLRGVAIMASKEDQISGRGRPKLEGEIRSDRTNKRVRVRFVVCNSSTCVNVDPLEPGDLSTWLMKTSRENPGQLTPTYLHPPGAPVASEHIDLPGPRQDEVFP